jgi:CheY-like chemotaxis protein
MEIIANATKRALLVDDEPVTVMILHRLLTAAGYLVEMADDGVKALAKYEPGKYSVIITDFLMPCMDGLELAQTIKTLSPTQPIMLVTGFPDRLKQERRSGSPIDCLLEKPFTPESFSEALAELVPGS